MPNSRRIVYWDACVFLSFLEGREGMVETIAALLEDGGSQNGQITILTSTLTIVEVAYIAYERTQGSLDPAALERIDALWADREAVKLVEVYELIVREARDLIRQSVHNCEWTLKAADAIHLATARRLGAVEFHTYDPKLLKHARLFGLSVVEPYALQSRLPL